MLTSNVNIRQSDGAPNGAASTAFIAASPSETADLNEMPSTPVLTAPLTGMMGEMSPIMPRFFDGSPLGAHQMNATFSPILSPYAVPNVALSAQNIGGEQPHVPGAWGPMSPATGEGNPTYTGRDVGSSGDPADGTNVPMRNDPLGTGMPSPYTHPLQDVASRMGMLAIKCEESASTVLLSTVRVDMTDPEFYTRMKFTYTVAQAAAAITRIDPNLSKNLKQNCGRSGTKTGLAIEKFVDLMTRGHKTSVQLTVCLLVHHFTDDERYLMYQRVQDTITAWMAVHDAQLPLLITHAKSGVIPEELLARTDLRLSNGMTRLMAVDPTSAYIHLYEFLFVTLSYEREGVLVNLKPLQDWKATHKYRQQPEEQLMYALSRERMRFSAVVDGCRAARMTSEIPSTVARVTNLQGIVLRNLWQSTERRIRYRDGHILSMDMTALTHELMAQERRDSELLVTDTALTGNSSQSTRNKPQTQQRDHKDPKERRELAHSKNTRKAQPEAGKDGSPSTKVTTDKRCSNHPESTTHSTRECKHATAKGVCYNWIRTASCFRGEDCLFSHDVANVTDRDKRDATEKEPKKKVRAYPTVATRTPQEHQADQYGSHLDKVDPARCVTYADALTNVRVFPAVAVAADEAAPDTKQSVQWKDDRELFCLYTPTDEKTVLPSVVSILSKIPEHIEIKMHAQDPVAYKPRWGSHRRLAAKRAELKPVATDAIMGPMSYATAVTRQGRQDGNHKGSNDTAQQDDQGAADLDALNELLDDDEVLNVLHEELTVKPDELHSEASAPPDDRDIDGILELITNADHTLCKDKANCSVNTTTGDTEQLTRTDSDVEFDMDDAKDYMSNTHMTELIVAGVAYRSPEHYIQEQKFAWVSNENHVRDYGTLNDIRHAIKWSLTAHDAINEAHKHQQRWTPAEHARWMLKAPSVICTANVAKYMQNRSERERLLSTGTSKLVETGSNDSYWGTLSDNTGDNKMGKILMQVRCLIGQPNKLMVNAPGCCSMMEQHDCDKRSHYTSVNSLTLQTSQSDVAEDYKWSEFNPNTNRTRQTALNANGDHCCNPNKYKWKEFRPQGAESTHIKTRPVTKQESDPVEHVEVVAQLTEGRIDLSKQGVDDPALRPHSGGKLVPVKKRPKTNDDRVLWHCQPETPHKGPLSAMWHDAVTKWKAIRDIGKSNKDVADAVTMSISSHMAAGHPPNGMSLDTLYEDVATILKVRPDTMLTYKPLIKEAVAALQSMRDKYKHPPDEMVNKLSVCVNKGTCAITTSDIETSIVNTNNGTYVIASETDRNNALRDAPTRELSMGSGSGSTSAHGLGSGSGRTRPPDHTNESANLTATHPASTQTTRITDQLKGMVSQFNGLLTHLNGLIGQILPCATHESATQHSVHTAPHLTDEIKGPMSHATAVTRQGRQDGNHKGSNDTAMQDDQQVTDLDPSEIIECTQGQFSFDHPQRTRNCVMIDIPQLKKPFTLADLATWTFQRGASALVMHIKLAPNRMHLAQRMMQMQARYVIALRPETACGINWHAAQTSQNNTKMRNEQEEWWDDNCIIGIIPPCKAGRIRIDGAPTFSKIKHAENYRLQKLVSIPPGAKPDWHSCKHDDGNAFTYAIYMAVISHDDHVTGNSRWSSSNGVRTWRKIVQLRLLDSMRMHATQSEVIIRPNVPSYDQALQDAAIKLRDMSQQQAGDAGNSTDDDIPDLEVNVHPETPSGSSTFWSQFKPGKPDAANGEEHHPEPNSAHVPAAAATDNEHKDPPREWMLASGGFVYGGPDVAVRNPTFNIEGSVTVISGHLTRAETLTGVTAKRAIHGPCKYGNSDDTIVIPDASRS